MAMSRGPLHVFRGGAVGSSGMPPLRLTTAQLDQVMRAARPLPLFLRGEYLALVARLLAGRDFGDGDVYRVCRVAAKQVMEDDIVLEVSWP